MEKITLNIEGEGSHDFFALEQTVVAGKTYLLVTDSEEGDGEALILKDISEDGEEESRYVIVSEDNELAAVAEVFEGMLEDVDLITDEEEI